MQNLKLLLSAKYMEVGVIQVQPIIKTLLRSLIQHLQLLILVGGVFNMPLQLVRQALATGQLQQFLQTLRLLLVNTF